MKIEVHQINNTSIAEVVADTFVIKTSSDGIDLLGNLYYQNFDRIILHKENVTPDFFDLKNGMAGEILQKFSNYRVRLAIVGDFHQFTSKSIRDFIYESNKAQHVNFLDSIDEALNVLSANK
jgi:hypothetical protein